MAENLVLELKKLIINTLKLEDIGPADIEDDAPSSARAGAGFDRRPGTECSSLEKTLQRLHPRFRGGKKVFRSVNALADFVKTHRA
jgi:acyl carrier protein